MSESEQMPTGETKETIPTGITTAIFDVDGVLIDSFPANLAFYQAVAREGSKDGVRSYKEFTEEEYKNHFGKSRRKVISVLTNASEKQEDQEEVDRLMELAVKENLYPVDKVGLKPGAEETVKTLSEEYELGIVTSRRLSDIVSLPKFEPLLKYFKVIVAAEDVDPKEQKPNPKPLFLACEKLGITPDQAVYIGDQESDIIAAKATSTPEKPGMKSIFYGENSVGNSDFHTNSLTELPNIIRNIK